MTLNLISTGLNLKSPSLEALETIKKCKAVYLENYTVEFPYSIKQLEKTIKKKVIQLDREQTESEDILKQAKKQNIALLVYGDALSATTHISLILACKKNKIPYKIIHSESIFTVITETGLQLYKFGKTASLPAWKEHYKPTSFADIIKQNQSIKAHTLLLVDIGLTSKQALEQLEEVWGREGFEEKDREFTFDNRRGGGRVLNINKSKSSSKKIKKTKSKIIICSKLGIKNSKVYYDTINKLKKKKISQPFCIIIPSELHFVEGEALGMLKQKS